MSDVLKGMTTAEARALVGGFRVEDVLDQVAIRSWNRPTNREACDALLALAAIGASVVGAREMWLSDDIVFPTPCEGDRRVLVLPESE